MKTDDRMIKTIFVNGKEVASFHLTGDEEKDMAAAKKLLAEQHAAESRIAEHEPAAECAADQCASS